MQNLCFKEERKQFGRKIFKDKDFPSFFELSTIGSSAFLDECLEMNFLMLKKKCPSQRISFFLLFLFSYVCTAYTQALEFQIKMGDFCRQNMRHIFKKPVVKIAFVERIGLFRIFSSEQKVAFWNDCFCLWTIDWVKFGKSGQIKFVSSV